MSFKKNPIFKRKVWVPFLIAILAVSGVSYWFVSKGTLQTNKNTSSQTDIIQTSIVRKGDLKITTTGTGTLVAGNSVDLSFSTDGIVQELNVKAGDKVTRGTVLAKMNNAKNLETQVAANELSLLEAQKNLNDLEKAKDVNLAQAYQDMLTAQETYNTALKKVQRQDYARCSETVNKRNLAALEKAQDRLEQIGLRYQGSETWNEAMSVYSTAKANYDYCIRFTDQEKIDFQSALDVADVALKQAKTKYETLKASSGIDPDELKLAEAKVEEARIKLELSKENLSGSTLTATIDGTVTYLKANKGAYVDTSTYITISDLSTSDVDVSINESDLDKLKLGAKASVVFDALPDETYTGEVVQINPELSNSGQYRVATAVINLENLAGSNLEKLPLGVNASVKITSDEITNALLVPAAAIRSIGDGQYGVFVVNKDGNMTFRIVEVGIKDSLTAEIKSGLELNETVSLGLSAGS
ncbi:MacA family efflux pump subunit [Leptolinea sp. HRD-7]|jgi:RND family efflux transporter MFP subunit|nr:MacA family efflux pump subunit [Leptolinea sp. HRD-7]